MSAREQARAIVDQWLEWARREEEGESVPELYDEKGDSPHPADLVSNLWEAENTRLRELLANLYDEVVSTPNYVSLDLLDRVRKALGEKPKDEPVPPLETSSGWYEAPKPKDEPCPRCGGAWPWSLVQCPTCKGTGKS